MFFNTYPYLCTILYDYFLMLFSFYRFFFSRKIFQLGCCVASISEPDKKLVEKRKHALLRVSVYIEKLCLKKLCLEIILLFLQHCCFLSDFVTIEIYCEYYKPIITLKCIDLRFDEALAKRLLLWTKTGENADYDRFDYIQWLDLTTSFSDCSRQSQIIACRTKAVIIYADFCNLLVNRKYRTIRFERTHASMDASINAREAFGGLKLDGDVATSQRRCSKFV